MGQDSNSLVSSDIIPLSLTNINMKESDMMLKEGKTGDL